jgi:hypothetical protein
VYHAAYFTKATCWGYEQERRMVAAETEVRKASGLLLLDAPVKCVSSIIVGSRATDETKEELLKKSQEIGCNYFEIRIGKSSSKPYFVDSAGQPYVFDNQRIYTWRFSLRRMPRAVAGENLADPMFMVSDRRSAP